MADGPFTAPFSTLDNLCGHRFKLGRTFLPSRIGCLVVLTKGVQSAKRIQGLQLRGRRQQRLLFMLSVHIH